MTADSGRRPPKAGAISGSRRILKVVLPVLATFAIVAPLAWLWQASRVPGTYSVMDKGYLDYGGADTSNPSGGGHGGHVQGHVHSHHSDPRLITDLVVDPARPADVRVDLVTRQQTLSVGGRPIQGFTINGTSPGPEIRVTQGQLVEVHLRNESVADGVTLHWHGLDVPNAMDGVAGVTQDAVSVGGDFIYRFVANQAGTYWYHSHQVSNPQVAGGLLGSVVVTPKSGVAQQADISAVAHTYGGVRTINGKADNLQVLAQPGRRVRLRVTNTDNGPMTMWTTASYRLLAVDGSDVHQPTEVSGRTVTLTGGSRADLEVTVPGDGTAVRVQLSKASAVVVGPAGADVPAPPPQPAAELDLLGYGAPAPLGFDPAHPNRRFDYRIDRRPGFVKGRPGMWWSINGQLFPNVPMYVVREGDVVVMRIENNSGEVHPMHLHGHHVIVLARDDVAASGSPWWVDSLNVLPGETYDIAFVANNPGIWMDHCHNLKHAAQGMLAHLMYEGFDTPYRIAGRADNQPE
jgi:FtsP/CotA-like multicopper oxidase with cupredoxin domain